MDREATIKTPFNQLNRMLCGLLALALALAVTSISAAAGETVRYIRTDHLGTPIAVTDENGNVVERYEYEPYGLQISGAIEDGPGYTGHVEDTATGLTYMQQRYYDPQIGMFLSVDPVTAYSNPVGQFSRYRYANGNPYMYTDPDGRSVWTKAVKLVINGGDMAATFAGVVEDANTVMDSGASTGARVIAGVSLASEVVSPISIRDVKAVGSAIGKIADKLPDNALVCRGGGCTADKFANGSGVSIDGNGNLQGVSVNSAAGKSLDQVAEGIPHRQVGVTTVGDVRAAGGDVVPSPTTNNPNHATMSGISPEKAEELMTPTVRNPSGR